MNAAEKYESLPVTTPEEVKIRDNWYQETFLLMIEEQGVEEFTYFKNYMKPTTDIDFLYGYLILYNPNFEGAPL